MNNFYMGCVENLSLKHLGGVVFYKNQYLNIYLAILKDKILYTVGVLMNMIKTLMVSSLNS